MRRRKSTAFPTKSFAPPTSPSRRWGTSVACGPPCWPPPSLFSTDAFSAATRFAARSRVAGRACLPDRALLPAAVLLPLPPVQPLQHCCHDQRQAHGGIHEDFAELSS